jgi:hypothetical protein
MSTEGHIIQHDKLGREFVQSLAVMVGERKQGLTQSKGGTGRLELVWSQFKSSSPVLIDSRFARAWLVRAAIKLEIASRGGLLNFRRVNVLGWRFHSMSFRWTPLPLGPLETPPSSVDGLDFVAGVTLALWLVFCVWLSHQFLSSSHVIDI